ncbi:MAG TPA: GAF domain-containing protein [Terriglobales bacterium]|jgi:hypothetical protein|nr:GAF domain-containing protein [Terriglobales bacterium]
MHGSAQPEDRLEPDRLEQTTSDERSAGPLGSDSDLTNGNRVLADTELDSALQLLVDRAQYITGATGAALALPQGDEMVCRASAGASAPSVGARLQVRSGLTGESIARRQLLRCDNAESDPRVNLDACRTLGIASIVVLPLLRKNGEVRGLFELFSDHPYAFEERDLIALERMAALTVTALDLAEQREKFVPAVVRREPDTTVASSAASAAPAETSLSPAAEIPPTLSSTAPGISEPPVALPVVTQAVVDAPVVSIPSVTPPSMAPPSMTPPTVTLPPSEPADVAAAAVPEAMRRVQKCAACGFPVSEGRTLCLDCEKKDTEKKTLEEKERERERQQNRSESVQPAVAPAGAEHASNLAPAEGTQPEFIPAFLANAAPAQESWLADHVNLLAIVVLILGILVAVVVFR